MNTFVKVALGLVGAAAVAGVTYAVVKKTEEKKQNYIPQDEEGAEEEKKETFVDKAKTYIQKKTIKAFAWIIKHKSQIEAVAAVLGIFTAIIKVCSAVRDFATGSEIKKTMDAYNKVMDDYTNTFNTNFKTFEMDLDTVFDYMKDHDQMIFDALKKGAQL